MELNFNQCLTLLIIGFVFALVCVRCLIAVVNRGFLLVDYAKEELYPGGKGSSNKFGLKDFAGQIMQAVMPAVQQKAMEFFGVSKLK